jgi:carbonic anhydrase
MLVLILISLSLACQEINYTTGAIWESSCSGGLQSPISIESFNKSKHYLITSYSSQTNVSAEDCPASYKILANKGKLYSKDFEGRTLVSSLSEIHFHSPSEHQISNKSFDLEIQLIHSILSESSYKKLVMSLFFNSSLQDAGFFSQFISNASLLELIPSFSLSSLIDSNFLFSPYFLYEGAMTTPPCEGPVLWYLVDREFGISIDDLQVFHSKWSDNSTFAGGNGNNREVQDLNGRAVQYSSS